jgi:SAM-dependent methyltransferase
VNLFERRTVEACTVKTVPLRFRGIDLSFALSHGLFSSHDIDKGTRFLLKVLSRIFDGELLPRTVLDAGCGAGIIAIAAAVSLRQLHAAPFHVRAQDRDDLARIFTEYNAHANGVLPDELSVHTEPLLSGPQGVRWDLVLSNIPAKAGLPVLDDFIRRLPGLLAPGGMALLVVVNTLADFFRSRLTETGGTITEENSAEHTVFAFKAQAGITAADAAKAGEPSASGDLLKAHPAYIREHCECELEGITLHLDTVHGAPDFDGPGGETIAAVKLAVKLAPALPRTGTFLVHESGQGWFPAWLAAFLDLQPEAFTLSGRNILALEAAAHNTGAKIIPAAELYPIEGNTGEPDLYGFIAAFPEMIPRAERLDALWEGISSALFEKGVFIVSLPSGEAERFDRKKKPGFVRLGDIRRNGFRALAYAKTPHSSLLTPPGAKKVLKKRKPGHIL